MHPRECVGLAQAADKAGLVGIWFAENAFARGILPVAAACALSTKNVRINAGVFNPYSRHPAMMAMEIGALDELSDGRASLTIGAGIVSATAKLGLNSEKPVPALRDAITIVRGLLRREEVDYEGPAYTAKKIRLDYRPRPDIPVYLAGRGNLTAKLAAEAADGLVISNMCSVQFAGRLVELMRSFARAAGRSVLGHVVQYMPCVMRSDSFEALKVVKRGLGQLLPRYWTLGQTVGSAKDGLLAGTHMSEADIERASKRLRAGEDPTEVLDDSFALSFSLAGTPKECLTLAAKYKAAGVDELALTFSGPTAQEEIAAIGAALVQMRTSVQR